jgi:hypothetical protein
MDVQLKMSNNTTFCGIVTQLFLNQKVLHSHDPLNLQDIKNLATILSPEEHKYEDIKPLPCFHY